MDNYNNNQMQNGNDFVYDTRTAAFPTQANQQLIVSQIRYESTPQPNNLNNQNTQYLTSPVVNHGDPRDFFGSFHPEL